MSTIETPAAESGRRVRLGAFTDAQIDMAHGAGGKASRRLVEGLIVPHLMPELGMNPLNDTACLDIGDERIAITTDSFVVRPLRFPGGSIGDLAVNGTVNDLATGGAAPLAMVCSLIVEAGTRSEVLRQEIETIGAAARHAGIRIVGGDTKVVEHGKADGLYITTTGIGLVDPRATLSAASVRPGDRVLVTGYVGDHGITVLLARGDIDLSSDLRSDTRSVFPFAAALLDAVGPDLRWMRDPTRGGVATILNELARDTGHGIAIDEDAVPIRDEVRGACELLGLDPLHIANEGQMIAVVSESAAARALEVVRRVPGGEAAALIGRIELTPARTVIAEARYGGTRVVDMLVGDPLPRIC
ncbi:MAG TPA: hydrogenase expression/formation protein HypE [Vicinamibacterales bacterium]|jgi:hydrogenase expression/formation protein HypE|nr:hydrogenase expression/formation protein HypE [Vicinamibacterales bacterium]